VVVSVTSEGKEPAKRPNDAPNPRSVVVSVTSEGKEPAKRPNDAPNPRSVVVSVTSEGMGQRAVPRALAPSRR